MAKNGGVGGGNFEVTFVSQSRNVEEDRLNTRRDQELAGASDDAKEEIESRYKGLVNQLARPDWTEIVDHIDHMVKVAGIDHVGLGSDFDGCRLPNGMEDCTKVPKITEELVRRGYSDADIRKILGENTLRVMEATLGE